MPKKSSSALLLEGKQNLLRLLQEILLGEAEQAAVEEGINAQERLIAKLADVPTPSGQKPRQIGSALVPITALRPFGVPMSYIRLRINFFRLLVFI